MELSNSNIKKFIIFSQKKAFLIFRETKTPKQIPYISGNGAFLYFRKHKPKKSSYISGSNFLSSKDKKNPLLNNFLYFGKWNFLAPSLKSSYTVSKKKLLYFRKELAMPVKLKTHISG